MLPEALRDERRLGHAVAARASVTAMRPRSIALAVIAACAGSKSGAPPPLSPAEAERAAHEAPASRDELVRATFDALAKHDARALARLADLDLAMTRGTTCDKPQDHHFDGRSAAERFAPVFERLGDARVQMIAVAKDEVAQTIAAGEKVSPECKTAVAVEEHRLELDVRVTKGADVHPRKATLVAVDIGGSWYLEGAPRVQVGEGLDMLGKLHEMRDAFCACKDVACVQAVAAAAQQWAKDHEAELASSQPDAAQQREYEKIGTDITACVQRAAGGAASP